MRISDWSSDVYSSDLDCPHQPRAVGEPPWHFRAQAAGRYLPRPAGTLGAEVGDGARRPAPGTRHRRDEPLPAAERARPVALPLRRAPAAIGTLYDPFIMRGLDALNYACYQDARFILVATPSGVTLAPEGGAHQSVSTPLIGLAQDGLASFEPAFVDELSTILAWSFDYLQRDGEGRPTGPWLRDEKGGSVYLRLSTRPLEQPRRALEGDLEIGRAHV